MVMYLLLLLPKKVGRKIPFGVITIANLDTLVKPTGSFMGSQINQGKVAQ